MLRIWSTSAQSPSARIGFTSALAYLPAKLVRTQDGPLELLALVDAVVALAALEVRLVVKDELGRSESLVAKELLDDAEDVFLDLRFEDGRVEQPAVARSACAPRRLYEPTHSWLRLLGAVVAWRECVADGGADGAGVGWRDGKLDGPG